jgi:hypothetical protein
MPKRDIIYIYKYIYNNNNNNNNNNNDNNNNVYLSINFLELISLSFLQMRFLNALKVKSTKYSHL